jgi:hypothetical protein
MLSVLASTLLCLAPQAGPLRVVSTVPTANDHTASRQDPIRITFDRPVDPASLAGNVRVFGENSGPRAGSFQLAASGARVVFQPAEPFAGGEKVRVVLAHGLRGQDGSALRRAGYSFEYRAFASRAALDFAPADSRNLRDQPQTLLRIYGGQALDLNRNGWIDLAVIDEDAWDIRVLLNRADGTGQYAGPVGQPHPIGARPSPNEVADFDGDGFVDICTANSASGDVSVIRGRGDGTFWPSVQWAVGANPRGLALLDADGDGDEDIVTANHGADNLSILFNNGTGSFSAPVFFDGGGTSEYALAAGDMNGDGKTDLVCGMRATSRLSVLLGNGDGSFLLVSDVDAGGQAWKVVLGDVDGDGHLDAATANSFSDSGSILLGDGAGGLALAQVVPGGPFVVAPDLGDMDGDGDLDFVLSIYNGGQWKLFANDGAGQFALARSFPALSNPACCVIFDIDRDGDLDLALLDEIADQVTLMENQALNERRYCFGDAFGALCPCQQPGDPGRGCENSRLTGGANLSTRDFTPLGGGLGLVDFVVRGLPSVGGSTVLLLRSQVSAGMGAPLGDGLLCLGSPVARLEARSTTPGGTFFDDLAHRAGAGTYYYQLVYRDTGVFCTPSVLNFSNGIELVWN